MSFCSECGNELDQGDVFCSSCGQKVPTENSFDFRSVDVSFKDQDSRPKLDPDKTLASNANANFARPRIGRKLELDSQGLLESAVNRRRHYLVFGIISVLILGASGLALAITSGNSSLPKQFTATQFERTIFSSSFGSSTYRVRATIEFSLGSQGSITEVESGVNDLANKESRLHVAETIGTPSSGSVTVESLNIDCFSNRCYDSGNFLGIPVTGATKAKWLTTVVSKTQTIDNPFAVINHAFKGTIRETPLPKLYPSNASAAYLANGSFTYEQEILALSKSLPKDISSLGTNSQAASLLSGINLSFRKAIVIVANNGALLYFDAPVKVTFSTAAAAALGENSAGSSTLSGKIEISRTAASPLHLVRPPSATVTTSAAVKASINSST